MKYLKKIFRFSLISLFSLFIGNIANAVEIEYCDILIKVELRQLIN